MHSYNRGKFSTAKRNDLFLVDKVTRAVLNQTYIDGEPVYPIDWMDESYDLLNNPEVLRQSNRFNWSDLERKVKLG